jgi:hypothetical protein
MMTSEDPIDIQSTSTDMSQATFDAPESSTVEAEKVKASPSASPSASSSTDSAAPASSSAGPKRYPVTPLPSAPVSAETYNGQDASDQTLSDDDSMMDTMGMDGAETASTSGQDFTAPYQ